MVCLSLSKEVSRICYPTSHGVFLVSYLGSTNNDSPGVDDVLLNFPPCDNPSPISTSKALTLLSCAKVSIAENSTQDRKSVVCGKRVKISVDLRRLGFVTKNNRLSLLCTTMALQRALE